MILRPGDRIRVSGWTRRSDGRVLLVIGVADLGTVKVVRALDDEQREHHVPVGYCQKVLTAGRVA